MSDYLHHSHDIVFMLCSVDTDRFLRKSRVDGRAL